MTDARVNHHRNVERLVADLLAACAERQEKALEQIANLPDESEHQPPGTAETREILGIHWCPTCEKWTMPADNTGRCHWCDRKLKNPVVRGAVLEARLANAEKQRRFRERKAA